MPEAFIYDHVRTPRGRGKPDGSLHEVTALRLAEVALRALKERNDLDTRRVDDVVLGCVDPVGEAGGDIARAAALVADYGTHVPGVQINRFCASGLDAVNFAAAQVMAGQHDMTVGGGVESMSRVGLGASGGAWPVDPAIALKSWFMPQGVFGRPHRLEIRLQPRRLRRLRGRVAEALRRLLGRGALCQRRRARARHQRHHPAGPGRAHAPVDRHAVARPAEGVLRADGPDGWLRRGGDRRASRRRGRSTHVTTPAIPRASSTAPPPC